MPPQSPPKQTQPQPPPQLSSSADLHLQPCSVKIIQPSSPRYPSTPTSSSSRRIAIAVDLSDESAFAVRWALRHYLRPGDAVLLLHVRPTSVLYGADWGSVDASPLSPSSPSEESQRKLEEDFDAFTVARATALAAPLAEARVPFKIHIVKDHDMKERLCLEVERLGLSAVIMGSRGFGAAARRGGKGRLGSVSDYCVRHCVCPVVVVRFPDEKEKEKEKEKDIGGSGGSAKRDEEETEFHDAKEGRRDA